MLRHPGFGLTPVLVTLQIKACLVVVDNHTPVEACISEPGAAPGWGRGRQALFMCPCVFTEEVRLCLESVFAHYEASSSVKLIQPGKWS